MGVEQITRATCELCAQHEDFAGMTFLAILRELEEVGWAINLRPGLIHGTTVCPICQQSITEDDAHDDLAD